jgi:uncharacterized integral membrane protein
MNYKLVLTLVLAGLIVLFVIQNAAMVEIQFLFWSTLVPRSLLMFIVLATGIIMGWFLYGYFRYKTSTHVDRSRSKANTDLKNEQASRADIKQSDRK